jgi:hypothetical protein
MKPDQKVWNTQSWNQQHTLLRELLEAEQDYPLALETFLRLHETVHAAALRTSEHWSIQDEVLNGLASEQMRRIPKGNEHSVVWALWHITRIEDVTLNILLANTAQVFHSGGWKDPLGSPWENVGNEMSAEEIGRLSEAVNLEELMSYRLCVGRRTQEIVRELNFTALREAPAPERLKRIAAEGAVGEEGAWLLEYWGGKPGLNLLMMPATRHPFVHLNEIRRLLPKLRRTSREKGQAEAPE